MAEALYTLGAGLVSVIGGRLMSLDIHLPFVAATASATQALVLMLILWRGDDKQLLDRR